MFRTIFFIYIFISATATAGEPPLIAVASNMSHALEEIAGNFEVHAGTGVKLSFGSSGNFTRQILQGAPYHLFVSADKKYVDVLLDNGHRVIHSDEFARGRIGFFVPLDSGLAGAEDIDDIVRMLRFNEFRRIVYANPELAPYGAAAAQALQNAGVWLIDRNKLLTGENAAQAMQISLAGGADIGIVPLSYAVMTDFGNRGSFFPIPAAWHQPIRQYLALLSDSNPTAVQFYDYLLSGDAQKVLTRFGYMPVR